MTPCPIWLIVIRGFTYGLGEIVLKVVAIVFLGPDFGLRNNEDFGNRISGILGRDFGHMGITGIWGVGFREFGLRFCSPSWRNGSAD